MVDRSEHDLRVFGQENLLLKSCHSGDVRNRDQDRLPIKPLRLNHDLVDVCGIAFVYAEDL